MKRPFSILPILFLLTSPSWSQTISISDSLEIRNKVHTVFELFENPDFSEFEKISTEKIYCIICFNRPDLIDEPFMLDRKEFFDNHLKEINKSDHFIRAKKSKKIILIKDNDHRTDITVFFTIYEEDELYPGHEGGQLGIFFKKVNGDYKFAGIETIP